jgi:hypothetical protein
VERVEILQETLTGIVMFLSEGVLPLAEMPNWFVDLAKPLFFTDAIADVRATIQDGRWCSRRTAPA